MSIVLLDEAWAIKRTLIGFPNEEIPTRPVSDGWNEQMPVGGEKHCHMLADAHMVQQNWLPATPPIVLLKKVLLYVVDYVEIGEVGQHQLECVMNASILLLPLNNIEQYTINVTHSKWFRNETCSPHQFGFGLKFVQSMCRYKDYLCIWVPGNNLLASFKAP